MSKFFKVNFWHLATQVLPPRLKFPLVTALLEAAYSVMDYVYNLFSVNRDTNLYHISITPQVCCLEKALNDRFDITERRIYISDGYFHKRAYVYTRPEDKPRYVYNRIENKPIYLRTRMEVGVQNFDFVVNVPAGLVYNRDEMTAFVEVYKLASKVFIINEF